MVWGNATVKQMLLEEIEEKQTLPAASDSNQDLDKIMIFCLNKFIEEKVSFDDHCRVSALKLCAFARKFKMRIVYQVFVGGASVALNFRAIARKFKAGEVGRAIDFRIVSIELVDGKPKVEWELDGRGLRSLRSLRPLKTLRSLRTLGTLRSLMALRGV